MIRTAFLLLIISFFVSGSQAQSDEVRATHKALVALYNSTDGDNWKNNTGWDTTRVPQGMGDFTSWYGLSVSSGKQLVGVSLYKNNLTGKIPPELGTLSNLKELRLGGNQLTGELPAELGNLSNLWSLTLNSNQLTGEIPAELGNLRNLISLGLDTNQLSGELPPGLGNLKNLKWLFLHWNQMMGEIPRSFLNLFGSFKSMIGNVNISLSQNVCYPNDHEFEAWMNAFYDWTFPIDKCTAVHTEYLEDVPTTFSAHPNYPNPFTSTTTISLDIPEQSTVTLTVSNVLGRQVYIDHQIMQAGAGQAFTLHLPNLPPGTYFTRMTATSQSGIKVKTGKFVKIR